MAGSATKFLPIPVLPNFPISKFLALALADFYFFNAIIMDNRYPNGIGGQKDQNHQM